TVVVDNEKEALLLENHLIKRHKPRFNIKLRDDKQYLVLRIDVRARFPRVEVVRNIADDGARYFGPYHSATSCRQTLRTVNRFFQLRTCSDHVLESRLRPCLQYQIKRCPGPCVLAVDEVAYREQVEDVMMFLGGKNKELRARLEARMADFAAREEFEAAARVRDSLHAIERTLAVQHVVQEGFADQDVFGMFREGDRVEAVVLFVRGGKMVGRRVFRERDQELPDGEVLTHLVQAYYDSGTLVPDEVIVPQPLEDGAVIADWLSGLKGRRVSVHIPQRGIRARLLALAKKNAVASARSHAGQTEDAMAGLEKLKQRLSLRRLPRRIECFDIAHIQGAYPVASMVVFVDGVPDKSLYRKLKIKTVQNDDFAAMYEAITRRFKRSLSVDDPAWEAPDLLVVDGGKGQLSSTVAALGDLGIEVAGERGIDVIALAKERELSETSEPDRVYVRGTKDPIRLRPRTSELFLLARIRDEAHRFANTFHRQRRQRMTMRSALDDVPGIGDVRKKRLLRHFGSLKAIKAASVEELAGADGMSRGAAEAVFRYFANPPA
ncbi:MAG TPA: excinuclease ABC subunit UvrC, partial [Kofleriaceae bacterium]|nr:excinuclease ABC subunit UvrC [Kofleriaceae bacterium]